jgi:hypothetical protein
MALASRQEITDRRSNHRYPVNVATDYKIVLPNRTVLTGFGWTVNMSSGGLLVDTVERLPRGVGIELSIAWPARLNNLTALKLQVIGRTVRTQGNCTAVVIRHCEFRTRGTLSKDRQSVLALSAGS